MTFSRQRFQLSTRGNEEQKDSALFTIRSGSKSSVLSLAAVLIGIGVGVVVYGRSGRVTKLWFPEPAPPSPPGMQVVVHDGMPLPGGSIYVSPEEFEERRRVGLALGRGK